VAWNTSKLGESLFKGFVRTGNADDLNAAISKVKQAVAAAPFNHSTQAAYLSNLGVLLSSEYSMMGNADDLSSAI
jgi:hypothetical protein